MAKKAKLDILDINIKEESEEPLQDDIRDDIISDNHSDEGEKEKKADRILAWIRGVWTGTQKIWFILIGSGLLIVIAGVSIWFHYGEEQKELPLPKQVVSKTTIPADNKFAQFDGFTIDLRDEKGNIRIAFCDIAVEMEKPQKAGAFGDPVNIRNVIYHVLKKKIATDGFSPEGRHRIKMELKSEMNRLLGENYIINIYFTRFEVI
jgi:flagellar basal body-associated protein FliL